MTVCVFGLFEPFYKHDEKYSFKPCFKKIEQKEKKISAILFLTAILYYFTSKL